MKHWKANNDFSEMASGKGIQTDIIANPNSKLKRKRLISCMTTGQWLNSMCKVFVSH